ncbi:MAG TPA: hypothetical protein VG322_17575, partial [Candidatus Acidoferrales bacterium]|nr:hypothetical protein [Candidatus Acidoferrales bacterium]
MEESGGGGHAQRGARRDGLSEVARVVRQQPIGLAGDGGQKDRNVGGVADQVASGADDTETWPGVRLAVFYYGDPIFDPSRVESDRVHYLATLTGPQRTASGRRFAPPVTHRWLVQVAHERGGLRYVAPNGAGSRQANTAARNDNVKQKSANKMDAGGASIVRSERVARRSSERDGLRYVAPNGAGSRQANTAARNDNVKQKSANKMDAGGASIVRSERV